MFARLVPATLGALAITFGLLFLMQTLNRMSQRSIEGGVDQGKQPESSEAIDESSGEGPEVAEDESSHSGGGELVTAELIEAPGRQQFQEVSE